MNKLPLELYDRIVHFVGRRIGEESLPPWEHGTLPFALPTIAAVSRNFQQAVERLTFRNLKITTSPSDLDVFRRVLTPQRQRNLQRLTVQLWIDHLLCTTSRPQPNLYATGEERRIINERTTVHLRELFDILAAWRLPRPSLALEVTSPPLNDKMRVKIRKAFRGEDYLRFSMVNVSDDLADFPPLPMVKELYVYSLSDHLHPHLAVSLTAKMPNVSHVDWDLSTCDTENWGLYHYMSRIWRDGLIQSIESTALPSSVEKFRFTMYVPEIRFQTLPDFIGSTSSPDPVCLALRKLTKDCAEVYIDGSVHTSLFDPLAATGIAPHKASLAWEKVTRLEVMASIYTPDGKWLFKRDPSDGTPESPHLDLDVNHLPPGYGSTKSELDEAEEYYEEHYLDITPVDEDGEFYSRTEVNDGPMNALLAAFARGCGRGSAPVLRTATLESEFRNDDNWPFQVTCFAAGEAAPLGWDAEFAGGDHGAWRVFFHVGDWRPAEETLEEFRRIGRERDGCDTVVCFLPWGNFLE